MVQKIIEARKRWVEALRSGKYKQTKGTLKGTSGEEGPRYCCLGVACDIYNDEYWDEWNNYHFPGESPVSAYLPDSLCDYYGLNYSHIDRLTEMNDSGDFSFEDIADYIEEKTERGEFVYE